LRRNARARKPHRAEGAERRRRAQQHEVLSEELRRRGQERHQRRLVGIPERRMPPAGDEVQLVAEEVVPPGDREMDGKGRGRQRPADAAHDHRSA
jgi:hypothetical protein